MSKWIRDRLRRRKKKPSAGAQPGENPPPLQPNFLASEMAAAPPVAEPEPAVREEEKPEPTTSAADGTAGAAAGQRAPGRRRRRRGRRGRGGKTSAAQAAARTAPLQPAYPEPAEAPAPQVPAAEPETQPTPRQRPSGAPAAQGRRPKGLVILAIGLPGSGKSTWFKRREAVPLSSDVIRSMLFDDVTEQRFQDLVFSTLRSLLRARLVARMPMNYVDATNLSPHDRRGWIKMAHDFGYEVQAVFFDVPTEVCMERNRRRNRVVPADVMQRMAGKLRPPKFDEGFSKITVVRVKRAADGEIPESGQGEFESQD